MRFSDDRYTRECQRFDTALRFIRFEARTHTIRHWTGLSDDRIRKLYHSYACESAGVRRHRGKSPHQPGYFLRTTRIRPHAAVLAGLLRLVGALPARPGETAAAPTLRTATLLCEAYEAYGLLLPERLVTFEHAVFLLETLWRGSELVLGACRDCHALLVVDRWSVRSARCELCALEHPGGRAQLALPLAPPGELPSLHMVCKTSTNDPPSPRRPADLRATAAKRIASGS